MFDISTLLHPSLFIGLVIGIPIGYFVTRKHVYRVAISDAYTLHEANLNMRLTSLTETGVEKNLSPSDIDNLVNNIIKRQKS